MVLEHIQADSGKHFDPCVVNAFMEMGNLAV
jgi:response regulator RpfG family c-di-GMP phosphodiesterase